MASKHSNAPSNHSLSIWASYLRAPERQYSVILMRQPALSLLASLTRVGQRVWRSAPPLQIVAEVYMKLAMTRIALDVSHCNHMVET